MRSWTDARTRNLQKLVNYHDRVLVCPVCLGDGHLDANIGARDLFDTDLHANHLAATLEMAGILARTLYSGTIAVDNGGQKGKKLLERAWDALLDAGVDGENARRLVAWMKEYILFHDRRHPQEMGMAEIQEYLGGQPFQNDRGPEDRAEAERALKFLYERVLERLWPMRQEEKAAGLGKSVTGNGSGDKGVYLNGGDRSVKLMTRVQNALRVGQYALETEKAYVDWILLMYGSGPRRKEACRVRVKDVDLERRQVKICDGKGDQHRPVGCLAGGGRQVNRTASRRVRDETFGTCSRLEAGMA